MVPKGGIPQIPCNADGPHQNVQCLMGTRDNFPIAVCMLHVQYDIEFDTTKFSYKCVQPMHTNVYSIQMFVAILQSNCVEGLHFIAFHSFILVSTTTCCVM